MEKIEEKLSEVISLCNDNRLYRFYTSDLVDRIKLKCQVALDYIKIMEERNGRKSKKE